MAYYGRDNRNHDMNIQKKIHDKSSIAVASVILIKSLHEKDYNWSVKVHSIHKNLLESQNIKTDNKVTRGPKLLRALVGKNIVSRV